MKFSANGKLLISGEYSVLRGALALAIPTKRGQHLTAERHVENTCIWKSFDVDNSCWFSAKISGSFSILETTDVAIASRLQKLLRVAKKLNPDFTIAHFNVKTNLDFDRNWGLGSSSTLVALVAQWACVDALSLFFDSFSGSGYDVAAALTDSPIFYSLQTDAPEITEIEFSPPFSDSLYFVYLGKKQISHQQVAHFSSLEISQKHLDEISVLTQQIARCSSLHEFQKLLNLHEVLTAKMLQQPTIKSLLFSDYPHSIKSLGAWGGDFILAIAKPKDLDYFTKKGYETVISWAEMVK